MLVIIQGFYLVVMNKTRAKLATADLVDCVSIITNRFQNRNLYNESVQVLQLAQTIQLRLLDVTDSRNDHSKMRSWKVLYHSLERISFRFQKLKRIGLISEEELYFLLECVEENYKFIRRYFAKKEQSLWRKGA